MKADITVKKRISVESSTFKNTRPYQEKVTAHCNWIKERYRLLYEGSADGYATINEDGVFMEYNTVFKEMTGYSDEELKTMTFKDITPKKWHVTEEKTLRDQILSSRHTNVYEKEFRRKDGTIFPAVLRTYLLKNENGKSIGIWAFIRDISERIRIEKKMKADEERFYKVFRSSPAPTYISTIDDGRYIDINDSGLSLLGYAHHEIIGHTVRELSIWENYKDRKPLLSRLLEHGSLHNELIRLRTKSGVIRETLWSSEIIQFYGEEVMLSLLLDITERKKAEDERRESSRRLADIIDFLPDATLVIDLHGKVIAWNQAIEEMTGVKAVDMLGKGSYEYAVPFYGSRRPILIDLMLEKNTKIEQSYDTIIKNGENLLICESWVPRLKGKKVFLWGKASPLYNGDGDIIGAIESIRDITDHKHAEDVIKQRGEELEKRTHELEDLNTAMRVLLKQREHDKSEIENRIISNMKTLVLPQLETMKEILNGRKALAHVNLLEANLNKICSPFTHKLSAKYSRLTNKEIQIANLVKEEKTTKMIAALLNISESAVNMHRYRIRQKFNLTKKHNLRVYLSNL